ncbi:MAG: hypothetical protein AAB538_01585 [Patescibacteria group bacterium]
MPKGGLSLNTDYGFSSPQLGYHGGLGFVFGEGKFGFALEGLVGQRTFASGAVNLSALWLNIPGRFWLRIVGPLHFTAGGYFAYGLGSVKSAGVAPPFTAAGLNPLDAGLASGIALTIPIGKTAIVLDTRAQFGLLDSDTSSADVRNLSFDFELGFLF